MRRHGSCTAPAAAAAGHQVRFSRSANQLSRHAATLPRHPACNLMGVARGTSGRMGSDNRTRCVEPPDIEKVNQAAMLGHATRKVGLTRCWLNVTDYDVSSVSSAGLTHASRASGVDFGEEQPIDSCLPHAQVAGFPFGSTTAQNLLTRAWAVTAMRRRVVRACRRCLPPTSAVALGGARGLRWCWR